MYSTRMHKFAPQPSENYDTNWWFLPLLVVLTLVCAALATNFGDESPASTDLISPAILLEPGTLYDSAPTPEPTSSVASTGYPVPSASHIIAADSAGENGHAPTF